MFSKACEYGMRPMMYIAQKLKAGDLFDRCGLGLKACNEKGPCWILFEFKALRSNLKSMLGSTRIEEVTGNLEKGLSYLKRP